MQRWWDDKWENEMRWWENENDEKMFCRDLLGMLKILRNYVIRQVTAGAGGYFFTKENRYTHVFCRIFQKYVIRYVMMRKRGLNNAYLRHVLGGIGKWLASTYTHSRTLLGIVMIRRLLFECCFIHCSRNFTLHCESTHGKLSLALSCSPLDVYR